jgi:hypothetical protein
MAVTQRNCTALAGGDFELMEVKSKLDSQVSVCSEHTSVQRTYRLLSPTGFKGHRESLCERSACMLRNTPLSGYRDATGGG